ncbi:ubiquitin-like-conjugating enzyme ATG10 [Anopheles moucheti]|uniref:ubiquitin-like-conjugating enzyme ATG10 n=1 Tax=Anopheles moucheti TaxID=186751 RepID=UPI0022F0F85D|nr:ubiquitin-like-conjugating enzyme ATG10 [Anopheles moucheti]XP_052900847.1 ubiquitin-like-conjugating enzyme ATG10 [Anopheles moucheti]
MHERDFTFYCDQLVVGSRNCRSQWRWVNEGGRSYIRLEKKQHVQDTFLHLQKRTEGGTMIDFSEKEIEKDPACAAIEDTGRILSFEYHILYNESYEVPSLLFNIYEEGGGKFNIEEAWHFLRISEVVPLNEMYQAITMVHHPILFRPYLNLHPCKASEMMNSLPDSMNPILSFLTSYGPFVNLEQDELVFSLHSSVYLKQHTNMK